MAGYEADERVERMKALTVAVSMAVALSATWAGAITMTALNGVINKVEKTIISASALHDEGGIEPGRPLVTEIAPQVRLTFSKENFDSDLKKAFNVYDGLLLHRAELVKRTKEEKKKARRPKSAGGDIAALMRAEKKTKSHAPDTGVAPNTDYSVYEDYKQTHQARTQMEDQAAEADMRAVIAERQAAETELAQKKDRKRALQEQAMRWQAELDKQAAGSARAAAEWERQHSFGAYARRFLGSVVQTAVGSFTGAFLTPIATNLANQAVGQMFPGAARSSGSLAEQAAAQATQDTITSVATGAGTSIGQAAGQAVTGTGTQPSTTSASTFTGSTMKSAPSSGTQISQGTAGMTMTKKTPQKVFRDPLLGVGKETGVKDPVLKPRNKFICRYPGPQGWTPKQRQVRY